MIKNTRYPHKLLEVWIRDREKCPIDHINASAAIVHLAQLCLEKVQPDQIYKKCMGWSIIRLLRDVSDFVDNYDMRHIANIMWSIGVFTSNMNEQDEKVHRDFRRLAAKLIHKFEHDMEVRRKCNVQNMVDMLWSMNCVGLKVHSFFYQFCVDLYCKLDIDLGVTPDALSYLAVLYATRIKLNEKVRIKPKRAKSDSDSEGFQIYNEKIPKRFWLKLLKEFSDDFVLIEAEPHQIANILWSFGRIGHKHLFNLDPMEEQWITQCFNKLLSFVQERLTQCDGQTLSMLLWCVTCSKYRPLTVCRKHAIFDYDQEKSIGSRILQLIETEDCFIIPPNAHNSEIDGNHYVQRYASKAYNMSLFDCIIIFEAATKIQHSVPNYILTLMLNRIKEQLKYGQINPRELISLLESVDMLNIADDAFYAIMGKKLVKVMEERSKRAWDYSEFLGLLRVIETQQVLCFNLDLVHSVLSAVSLNKQGWGQMDGKPMQLLLDRIRGIERQLKEQKLIVEVDANVDMATERTVDGEETDEAESVEGNNLSVLIAVLQQKINDRLETLRAERTMSVADTV